MKYIISYGYGIAIFYTPYKDVKNRFMTLANTCFGIRKSILKVDVINSSTDKCDYFEKLVFNDDVYVWREDGARKNLTFDPDNEWTEWDTDYCESCNGQGLEKYSYI